MGYTYSKMENANITFDTLYLRGIKQDRSLWFDHTNRNERKELARLIEQIKKGIPFDWEKQWRINTENIKYCQGGINKITMKVSGKNSDSRVNKIMIQNSGN